MLNYVKLRKTVQNCAKLCETVPSCAKLRKMFELSPYFGTLWHSLAQIGTVWHTSAHLRTVMHILGHKFFPSRLIIARNIGFTYYFTKKNAEKKSWPEVHGKQFARSAALPAAPRELHFTDKKASPCVTWRAFSIHIYLYIFCKKVSFKYLSLHPWSYLYTCLQIRNKTRIA